MKKAKSEYYLSITSDSLHDPKRFWKAIKSLSVSDESQSLPRYIANESSIVVDKHEMLNCFNEHFIQSGSSRNSSALADAFHSQVPATPSQCNFVFSPS